MIPNTQPDGLVTLVLRLVEINIRYRSRRRVLARTNVRHTSASSARRYILLVAPDVYVVLLLS